MPRTITRIVIAACLLAFAAIARTSLADTNEFVQDELLVGIPAGAAGNAEALQDANTRVVGAQHRLGVYRVNLLAATRLPPPLPVFASARTFFTWN